MQTELVKRSCDFCNHEETYAKDAKSDPQQERNLENWITMAKVYLVNGQQFPVVVHCCTVPCARGILSENGLDLPAHIRMAAEKTN